MKFLCPNDHVITCRDSRAGRLARCPECQVLLQVPQPVQGEMPRAVELFEFLCPNDHRLTAPVSRAGRSGKCPHCGEEFQIPELEEEGSESQEAEGEQTPPESAAEVPWSESVEEVPAEPLGEASVPTQGEVSEGVPVPQEESPQPSSGAPPLPEAEPELPEVVSQEPQLPVPEGSDSGPRSDVAEVLQGLQDQDVEDLEPLEEVPPPPPPVPPPQMHPVARMFETLWHEMDEEAMFEVTLEDGHRFMPVAFSEASLHAPAALFATSTGENNHVVILVPWDKVARVTVRGVKELPKGLFE